MTLLNCERLLKHYKDTGQDERAKEMGDHIKNKISNIKKLIDDPDRPHSKYLGQFKVEEKPEDGKKPKR